MEEDLNLIFFYSSHPNSGHTCFIVKFGFKSPYAFFIRHFKPLIAIDKS